MTDFLKDLNNVQQQAVKTTDGPMMVIAGAGSGKTRVLTFKVAYLLSQGVDPFRILALTFTNKAAREMKERIYTLVGNKEARNVWMGTFHSVFSRILRIEGDRLGYPSNFTIYDNEDSKRLIRNIVKENNLDPKTYQPGYILHRISSAKSSLVSATDYFNDPEMQEYDRMANKPKIGQIFLAYQNRLYKSAAMDFDDLLVNTFVLLEQFPEVLYKYQQMFEYILIDEYQDTNHVQYMILNKLAANNENLCVVGDDAQSIYAFRGANIRNILNFRKDFPDAKIFKLEQNYRSSQTIVNASNSVIGFNKDQITKSVWTDNDAGTKIKLLKANSDGEEGELVAGSIFEYKMNYQLKNDNFAILYRTNAQSRSLEEALRRLNIPYRIYGGLSFYQRKEIKDLLAYFRLTINHKDEEALERIINYPARGIGKTTLEKIRVEAEREQTNMWEIIKNIDQYKVINAGTRRKLADFATMIESFAAQLNKKNAYDLGMHIARSSGIVKNLHDDESPEGVNRYENLEELLNGIREFVEKEFDTPVGPEEEITTNAEIRTLQDFMQDIALLTDADTDDDEDKDRVSLMTIHGAKGLEFPFVYITGLEENLFPNVQSLNSRSELEEERRLFYVAMTRARKQLVLSYATTRYRWGNFTVCEPSRFIEEVNKEFLELPKKASIHPEEPKSFTKPPVKTIIDKSKLKKIDKSDFSGWDASDTDSIQAGMQVEHVRFGKGSVVSIEGQGPNKKATVDFASAGKKQLLLRFARLKIIS